MFSSLRNKALGRRRYTRPDLPGRPKMYQGRRGTFVVSGLHRTRRRLRALRAVSVVVRVLLLIIIAAIGLAPYIQAWPTGRQARILVDNFLLDLLPGVLNGAVTEGRLHGAVWFGLFAATYLVGRIATPILSRPTCAWLFPRRTSVRITPRSVMIWRWWVVPWWFKTHPDVKMTFRTIDLPGADQVIDRPMSTAEARDEGRKKRILSDTGRLEFIYGARRILVVEILGKKSAEQFSVCLDAAVTAAAAHAEPSADRKPKRSTKRSGSIGGTTVPQPASVLLE